jgi:vitamin B12 transporter
MNSRLLHAAVAAVLVVACAGARAESSDALPDDVVVVANRMPEPLSRVGNAVTVLDAEEIRLSQAVDIADLIAQTPGVSLTRTGVLGAQTSVFIRGAESYQTVVMIDGVVLNDPSTPSGGFDFQNLVVGDISRIEILRGAQSTLYGSDAMGGVVNIITADPSTPFGGTVSAEGGTHDTGLVSGAVGGTDGALLWRLATSWYGTTGFPDHDEQLGGKRPSASQIGTGSGQLRYDFTPDVRLDVRGYFVASRTDFDGYFTGPDYNLLTDDDEYGKVQQALGYAGLTVRSPDESLTHRIAVQYTGTTSRDYNPDFANPASPQYYPGVPSLETFYGIGRNLREEYQGTWVFSPRTQLVFGAQHERATIDFDTPAYDLTPSPLEEAATTDSGYLQLSSEVVHGLTLTGGGRYDHHDVYGGHATGQAALAFALDDQQTVLRASFGQGFRSPSLYQLYSLYGNRALEPEEANSWDAGVERHSVDHRLVGSVTYFERRSRDLINFFDCFTPSPLCSQGAVDNGGYYANITRTYAQGIELEGSYLPAPSLTLTANLTWTDTADRSPGSATYGNELPRRPRYTGNAAVSWRAGARWTTSLDLRYSGASYDDAANAVALGGYVLLDARAAYAIRDGLEVYGRVENAGGRHYETVYQYGTPGRVGMLGVRISF